MRRIRLYHATLGGLTLAAFLSGEAGLIHALIGYAIGLVILGRLAAALSGQRALGLSRFYPVFAGLRLRGAALHPAISKTLLAGIAVLLIATTVTGIGLDRGRALGLAGTAVEARADHREESALGEGHEALANALMLLVGLHVAYLLVWKRPLARFMLFVETPPGADPRPAGAADKGSPNNAR
jgi:cytochrome b